MYDLITIGDATFDTFIVLDEESSSCHMYKDKKLLCLNFADKTPITNTAQSAGGNAANVAVGVRKLGLETAIYTEIGDDVTGQIIESELERARVDTSLIKVLKGKETRYSIILNYETERTVLSYHAKRKYSLPHLPHTKWIYYTSMGKTFEAAQKKLISHLKKHPSVKLAMNPGSYQFKHGCKTIGNMLKHTDLLFVNKEEAACLFGKTKKPIRSAIKGLHREGVKEIVVTDGTDGAYASDGTNIYHMPIYKIQPLAKTGAGDAFASGYLAARIYNKDVPTAMKWGTANAASVIQKFGAQVGLATRAGIKRIVEKHKNTIPTTP